VTVGDGVEVARCPARASVLERLLREFNTPGWLLVGADQTDDSIAAVARSVQSTHPDCLLAMLGRVDDWLRCERWLLRGCRVYLAVNSELCRVLFILAAARQHDILAVDSCFLREVRRRLPLDTSERLTKREKDVLLLLHTGLSNRRIAAALRLSENTIEFHVGNLLNKLGAQNRLEAVQRARTLGL